MDIKAIVRVDEDDTPGMEWNRHIVDGAGNRLAFMATDADDAAAKASADHLAASWNACAGVPTADLRPGMLADLIRENAEMRAALRACYDELKAHDLTVLGGVRALLNGEVS